MTNKIHGFPFAFILICSLLIWNPINAQTGSVSPYSRYGIGDILQDGFTNQTAMGGIGAALYTSYYINVVNPAALVADTSTLFEFGAKGEVRELGFGDQTTTLNSASFSYFALAFPIKKNKLSACFGLLPFTSVGYNIVVDEKDVPDFGNIKYKYEGTGGFNKAFLGAGYRINKNFSTGLSISYLFGTIENTTSLEFPNSTNYFNSRYISGVTANGFYANYGLLYQTRFKKDLEFKAGLTGSFATKVNATNNRFYYNYTISSFGGEILKDSIYNEQEKRGNIRLPSTFRLGFTLGKSASWLAGMDFSYENWEKFENFESEDTLNNSYTFNIGGEKRTKKLVYRLGGRYTKTYLNLKETQLDDYGITFGIGLQKLLPKRPPSSINLAIEIGQRGTNENNLLKEQYIRFHLGFTLTDSWFNRPKYD